MTTNKIAEIQETSHYEYPLDRYLIPCNTESQALYEESNIQNVQENISILVKVKDILKSADYSLKCMSLCLTDGNAPKEVHIKEAAYFDEEFDRSRYIKELVRANLNGHKVIQTVVPAKISNILNARKFVLNKMLQERDMVKDNAFTNEKVNAKVVEINALKSTEIVVTRQNSKLSMTHLPGINIRSELKEQKFPVLDIQPSDPATSQKFVRNNILVIESKHGESLKTKNNSSTTIADAHEPASFIKENTAFEPAAHPGIEFEHYQEAAGTPYLFLNQDINEKSYGDGNITNISKKNISKLKKFGVPEIANIYNPKPQFVINRRKYPNFHQRMFEMNRIDGNSSGGGELNLNYNNRMMDTHAYPNTPSCSKSKGNLEYIPYSKLTIGGIKPEEAAKQYNHGKKSDGVRMRKNNKIMIIDDNSEMLEDDEEQSSSGSIIDYVEEFDTTDSQKISESQSKISSKKVSFEKKQAKQTLKSLKLKNKIDTFDYIHYVETKDMCTQSGEFSSLYKKTQTSPLNQLKKDVKERELHVDDSSEISIDLNKMTVGELLYLEKKISSLKKQLENQKDTTCKENIITTEIHDTSFITRVTQTSPSETAYIVAPLVKMEDKNISPIMNDGKVDTQTSPPLSKQKNKIPADDSKSNTSLAELEISANTTDHDNIPISPKKTFVTRKNISSDTYSDVSRSETSETFSVGEVNLTILRKRIIRVLNQNNSCSNTSSVNNSNEDCLKSSSTSEGEIVQKRNF